MVGTGPFADRSRILTGALQWQRARCDHECQSGSLSWYRRRYVKVGGVWSNGAPITTTLLQRSTDAQQGPDAVVRGWVAAIVDYLVQNNLDWDQVRGVGHARAVSTLWRARPLGELACQLRRRATATAYSVALAEQARRPVAVTVGNDGDMGGVAEAQRVHGDGLGTVVLLAPGSGLGCAYIDRHGLPLAGDTLAGMEGGHMPAALHELGVKPYPCGCGRTWGCIEVYTTLSGLPYLLAEKLAQHPDHGGALRAQYARASAGTARPGPAGRSGGRRDLRFQARALGIHVANLAMALDPQFVVIGGGLMDPQATSEAFRERYLSIVRNSALPYVWPAQRENLQIVPATLGDLSQAIGAALAALYRSRL